MLRLLQRMYIRKLANVSFNKSYHRICILYKNCASFIYTSFHLFPPKLISYSLPYSLINLFLFSFQLFMTVSYYSFFPHLFSLISSFLSFQSFYFHLTTIYITLLIIINKINDSFTVIYRNPMP